MKICPHCGAENAESSAFCSLCLARFDAAGGSAMNAPSQPPAYTEATAPQPSLYQPVQPPVQPYVSPGDYRALAQEMAQQSPQAAYRDSAYYGAAMQYPGAISSVKAPAYMRQRSSLDVIIMLLSYSFLTYILLFVCRFILSIFLLGAAFGGSEAGLNIGIALIFVSDALLLALGGYIISAKAMHAGKGWLYGLGCVACVVFVWQPLVALIMTLLMTGEVYIPLFTLVGVLFTLFLELPMGALGGWIAEKRYMS